MITIISSSNRKGNVTKLVAAAYKDKLQKKYDGEIKTVYLENMPSQVMNPDMYVQLDDWIKDVRDNILAPSSSFVFVIPEYNGTFPGVLKIFMDAVSSDLENNVFLDKKAALIGLSAGKFGNRVGLEHFSTVLNYLKTSVYYQKVAIPNIMNYIDGTLEFEGTDIGKYLDRQIEGFLKF